MNFLRGWVGMLVGVGHRSALIVGPVSSRLSRFFLSVHRMVPRDNFSNTCGVFFLGGLMFFFTEAF